MLSLDFFRRPDIKEVLSHPFLNKVTQSQEYSELFSEESEMSWYT